MLVEGAVVVTSREITSGDGLCYAELKPRVFAYRHALILND